MEKAGVKTVWNVDDVLVELMPVQIRGSQPPWLGEVVDCPHERRAPDGGGS
jgi:hypothetical protein